MIRSDDGDARTAAKRNHMLRSILTAGAAIITLAFASIGVARAQAATPVPSPSPSPQPSGPSDPCGSILSIVTRPTVTTSVCTVREGQGLVETGYTNTTITGAGGGTLVSYPQALVRVGIGKHVEAAFTPPSYNRSSLGDSISTGSSDMNFGAKWEIGYSDKASWGANFQISAPTGDPAFTAGGTQYTVNANWTYTFTPVFGAGGTFGFNSLSGANANGQFQRYSSFIPSIDFTAALSQNSVLFGEYAYFSHAGPSAGGKSLIDFGYVHDFGEHVQLDIEYGFQPTLLNGQKQHYFGFGVSLMS
jgi:hypothetical protein